MRSISQAKKVLLVMACCVAGIGLTAESQARFDVSEALGSEFFTCDHLSNNLWGLHEKLEENYGLSFEVLYLQDFFWNTRGGINTGDSGEYPRLIGAYFELDTEKAGLWRNGTFFLGLEHISGRNPS